VGKRERFNFSAGIALAQRGESLEPAARREALLPPPLPSDSDDS